MNNEKSISAGISNIKKYNVTRNLTHYCSRERIFKEAFVIEIKPLIPFFLLQI